MQYIAVAVLIGKGEQGMLIGGTPGHEYCADPVSGSEIDRADMVIEKTSDKPGLNLPKGLLHSVFRAQYMKQYNSCNNFLLISKEIEKNLLL